MIAPDRLANALELEASDDPRFGLWCVQVGDLRRLAEQLRRLKV